MTKLLLKIFVKNYKDVQDATVIEKYGILSSIVGILLNIFLCISKFIIGFLSNSISMEADAINNLSDVGSSVISMLSFRVSNRPADKEHPFGHERAEYIASFIVAFIIISFGLQLMIGSFDKIFNPQELSINFLTFFVVIYSIFIKLWLYLFNRSLGKTIKSTILKAVALDSITDVLSTSGILCSFLISVMFDINIDGFVGVLVSAFILISGFGIVKESFNNIIGVGVDETLAEEIKIYIMNYDKIILGTHDLMVHTYGSNRRFATVHVEVCYRVDFLHCHDIIDNLEKELSKGYNMHTVIHLDPIITDDMEINETILEVDKILKGIDNSFAMHDFRMVKGDTHTKLIFEVEISFDFKMSNIEISTLIEGKVKDKWNNYYTSICIDRV